MTEKRFEIRKSMFIADGYVIDDIEREYTFSALTRGKVMNYWRVLNSMNDKLKKQQDENFMLKEQMAILKLEIKRLNMIIKSGEKHE